MYKNVLITGFQLLCKTEFRLVVLYCRAVYNIYAYIYIWKMGVVGKLNLDSVCWEWFPPTAVQWCSPKEGKKCNNAHF